MRRQIIDYFDTRSSDGTSSLSPKRIYSSMRRQLIDYFGTQPLEGQVPYLQEKQLTHEVTICRLLQYSTYEEARSLFSKKESSFTGIKTSWLLGYSTRAIQVLHFLEGTIHPRDDKQINYYGNRRRNPRQPTASFMKRQPADRLSTQKEKYYTSEC